MSKSTQDQSVKRAPGRPKGMALRTEGTPATVVDQLDDETESRLVFGGKARKSPYISLLNDLRDRTLAAQRENRPKMPFLVFESVKARTAVLVQARKIGLELRCAEDGGKLFVKLHAIADPIAKRVSAVLAMVGAHGGPLKSLVILQRLRANGDATVDLSGLNALLERAVREGKLVRQDGDGFRLPAKKVAAA